MSNTRKTAISQKWERIIGNNRFPDGVSLHLNKKEWGAFMDAYHAQHADNHAANDPAGIEMPLGAADPVPVDDETYARLEVEKSIRCTEN